MESSVGIATSQSAPESGLLRKSQDMHFGEALIVSLNSLLKGVALYQRSNTMIERLVQECLQALYETFSTAATDALVLQLTADACLCNRQRIRISAETLAPYKAFIQTMKARGIGMLSFTREVTAGDLADFVFIMQTMEEQRERDIKLLSEQLEEHDIASIRIGDGGGEQNKDPEAEAEELKKKSKEVYFSTIGVIRDLALKTMVGQDLMLRSIKRLMMSSVNLIMREESSLLTLANIKTFDDYTFSHSVNVAIYAVALGQRVGLPRTHLYHLGICGLFHDVGKQDIPKEILNKPGALTPEEWEIIRTHPVHGAVMALSQKNWSELLGRIMITAFEHHIKYDRSGYPVIARPRMASLFSRIISIADCYDALSRPRVYRKAPFLSEKILGMMLAQSGKDFDPLLVKLFINMVGVYPIGALVLLNTHQIGIVTRIPDAPDLIDCPEVRLLHREDGIYVKGKTLDLSATDAQTGEYLYHIEEILNPNEYDLDIEEFYL